MAVDTEDNSRRVSYAHDHQWRQIVRTGIVRDAATKWPGLRAIVSRRREAGQVRLSIGR